MLSEGGPCPLFNSVGFNQSAEIANISTHTSLEKKKKTTKLIFSIGLREL